MTKLLVKEIGLIDDIIGNMDNIVVDFGSIKVLFAWEKFLIDVGDTLKSWFRDFTTNSMQADIGFIISPTIYDNFRNVNSKERKVSTWAWDAVLVANNKCPHLWICRPRTTLKKYFAKALPKTLFRFINPLGASYWELQTGYFLYHIVIKQIQDLLLQNGASFIHAAGLSNSSKDAVIICGSGGIGKTTTAANFVSKSKGHWKIIAEDFVIVSEEGKIYGSHLPAHIYGYHLSIMEQLGLQKDFFKDWLDRLQWNIYSIFKSPSGVVRRVTLPKNILAFDGTIKICFVVEVVMSEEANDELYIQPITYKEAAHLALNYTLNEMKHGNWLNESELLQTALKIISTAFRDAVCYKVRISENKKGLILAQAIWEKILEEL